jgi:hypothetical protein
MLEIGYLFAIVLIGYGIYNWRRTGMRRYLFVIALGICNILVFALNAHIRNLVDISSQMNTLLSDIGSFLNFLMTVALVAFIITEWRLGRQNRS